jgi:hypothetical protein
MYLHVTFLDLKENYLTQPHVWQPHAQQQFHPQSCTKWMASAVFNLLLQQEYANALGKFLE